MIYYVGPHLYEKLKKAGVPEHMLCLTKPLPIDPDISIWKKLAAFASR